MIYIKLMAATGLLFLLIALSVFAAPQTARVIDKPTLPQKLQIPFELKGGLIFIKVKVNGKPANFILDSGAPTLVLSKRLENEDQDLVVGKGVSGAVQLQLVEVPSFELGEMKLQDVQAIALDLKHLEQITKRPIDGLIGYSTLKDYEVLLDYKTKYLTLFKPNATDYHKGIKPKTEMSFELQAHLPVIEVKIGSQIMKLGLDTGAEANLLDLTSQTRLHASDYRKGNKGPIAGANQSRAVAQEAYVNSTFINGHNYKNMHFVFSDISHMNKGYGLSIDGLLGYPFLSARKLSVNFKDSKVYFWE